MKNKVQIMSLKQYVAFIIGILLCILSLYLEA